MPGQNELIPKGSENVTFPDPWLPHGDDIRGVLQEGSWFEPFDLELERRSEKALVQGAEGLLRRQACLVQEPFGAASAAQGVLLPGQFMQIGFMRESFFGGPQSEIGKLSGHPGQLEPFEQGFELLMAIERIRHGRTSQRE